MARAMGRAARCLRVVSGGGQAAAKSIPVPSFLTWPFAGCAMTLSAEASFSPSMLGGDEWFVVVVAFAEMREALSMAMGRGVSRHESNAE